MRGAAIVCRPLWTVQRLRRRAEGTWPRLPRPCISVGNLAFGGRGKTPLVAALALEAQDEGLRPGILVRGYGARRSARAEPLVLEAGPGSDGPVWMRSLSARGEWREAWRWAPEAGDESAWLAATCPGLKVGVHPRREQAAHALLELTEVDFFLLDDGFQTPVARDLDLVVLDPEVDPPLAASPGLVREGPDALDRADRIAVLSCGPGPDPSWEDRVPDRWLRLRRTAGPLRWLHSGEIVDAQVVPEVQVAAGVGRPDTVTRLAQGQGLRVVGRVPTRDHHAPSRLAMLWAGRGRGVAVLVTEKDAVGWAAASPPAPDTVVLAQRIEGASGAWASLREGLDL